MLEQFLVIVWYIQTTLFSYRFEQSLKCVASDSTLVDTPCYQMCNNIKWRTLVNLCLNLQFLIEEVMVLSYWPTLLGNYPYCTPTGMGIIPMEGLRGNS